VTGLRCRLWTGRRVPTLLLLLAPFLSPGGAPGQTPPAGQDPATRDDAVPLVIPRLSGPITLDGRVDEPAWEAIPPLPVVMHLPNFGAEPTERTEFRLAYDDEAIYFSCRNYDSDPSGIQATTLRRDGASLSNDWCVLQLDTFNDKETALAFGTTPAGIRTDVVWPNDGASGGNFSWNTFWDAAVHRDDQGWYAELRIPLSSLRFQERDGSGVVIMGMSAWRLIARKNEFATFPAIDNRWGGINGLIKASQYREVAFGGIRPRRPVYVTPYGLAARGRRWVEDPSAAGYARVHDRQLDIGGDVKYALASNLTLDLTFNTDFAQAEADDQQVNLTRFSLFFPEKRLFFQERGEMFEFSLGGNERLFHSRRIGLVEGSPVPIRAGARVVGRLGDWDVGLLNMQTEGTSLAPAENLGVLRLRRRVLNENSYLGGIFTSRLPRGDGGHDLLYGLDGIFRLFDQDYLVLSWAQSFADDLAPPDPGGDPAPAPLDRALARLHWQRRGVDGFTYSLELARVGDTFDPGLGFLLRRDYSKAAVTAGYGWRHPQESRLLRNGVRFGGTAFTRNHDGPLETAELTAMADVVFKSGHELSATLAATHDDLRDGFSLSPDAEVLPGEHRFVVARLAYTPPGGSLIRANASLDAGQFYDGRILAASVSPTWFASRHLELGGAYLFSRITFPDRDQSFAAHVARLRSQVMINARLLVSAFVQYNSATDRVSSNLRLRYNPAEGNDLYLVWNEQVLTDRTLYDPVPPRSENRIFVLKYARTLTLDWRGIGAR
jgi:hypothetical protein